MVVPLIPGVSEEAAIMACIGHVCVQWAQLENNILAVLCACQNVPVEEAAILFGSLDMKPRLNMAINLARRHKWPTSLLIRLDRLRKAIDKAKLLDRRNMVVHGVHRATDTPQTVTLYTPRRSGSAQYEDWTIEGAHQLGVEIMHAANEAWDIFASYGRWKFGNHFTENSSGEIVTAPLGVFARFKQYLSARIKHLIG